MLATLANRLKERRRNKKIANRVETFSRQLRHLPRFGCETLRVRIKISLQTHQHVQAHVRMHARMDTKTHSIAAFQRHFSKYSVLHSLTHSYAYIRNFVCENKLSQQANVRDL